MCGFQHFGSFSLSFLSVLGVLCAKSSVSSSRLHAPCSPEICSRKGRKDRKDFTFLASSLFLPAPRSLLHAH